MTTLCSRKDVRRAPPGGAQLENVEERDGVRGKERGHEDRQTREVALHDVLAALRRGGETHAAKAGVPPGMHEDKQDEEGRKQYLEDG